MKIANNNVVNIKYKLTDNDNNVLDQSDDGKFSFLMGAGNIIPGLENALVDRQIGDTFSVNIDPAEAYGEYKEDLVHKVPRTQFPQDIDIEVGMQFQGQTPDGHTAVVKVAKVTESDVFVDNNHPLAGVALNFDVEVTEVREASASELSHGHVHQAGDEHH